MTLLVAGLLLERWPGTAASTATVSSAASTAPSAASVVTVATVYTALTEGLHVLALFFASPFATSGLLTAVLCTLSRLA